MQDDVILVADVGGTNARFATYRTEGDDLRARSEHALPSRSGATFLDLLRAALPSLPGRIAAATVGIAGPVRDGVCRATNLPWIVSAAEIAHALRLPRVVLLNDLEAAVGGLEALAPTDLVTLSAGRAEAEGPMALLAVGTGLGAAAAVLVDGVRHAVPTESGHVSFAPTDERQVRLWRRLMTRHDTVSWERVVSGPGLIAVYEFVRDEEGAAEPASVAAARGTDGHGPAIVAAAVADPASVAGRALEFFTELWGAEAGNVALALLATGGFYLGGGLAARVLPWLRRPAFREAFLAKGRMRPVLEPIPLHVILESRTALLGALLHARRHLVR